MFAQLLHRITTKIRRLGYAKERARFLAGFLVTEMVVVAVIMGMLRFMQNRECDLGSDHSTRYITSVPAGHCYAPFGIQR